MKVVCLNTGTGWTKDRGTEYATKLYRALTRNTAKDFDFECITAAKYPGWWNKLLLFDPAERILFFDLDVIITGNIDFLFEYDGQFAICRDFYRPNDYGSDIMSIAPGYGKDIKERFEATPDSIIAGYPGDQDWIRHCVNDADLWQDIYPDKIKSFKADCLDNGPAGASVVVLHGRPKNHELTHLSWVREAWK